MKKLFNSMMVLSSLFIIASCSKSSDTATPAIDDVKVTITVTANDTTPVANNGTVFPDDKLLVTVTCTGNDKNNLTNVKLTATNATGSLKDTVISGTSATKTYSWIVVGTGPVTYTATATGSTGKPGTASFTVVVTDIILANPVLGNQVSGANKRFWSVATPTLTYDLSDVLASPNYALDTIIDMGYCSRTTAAHLLFSPDDVTDADAIYGTQWGNSSERITNWTHRNSTKFKLANTVVSASQFTSASTKAQINALILSAKAGLGEPDLNSVSVIDTQVYLFKTSSGKYGLIYITSATGGVTGTTVNPGDAQLQVVYQN